MSTDCKICKSIHRDDYEFERKSGRTYMGLMLIASKRFNERISAQEFKNHFEENKHAYER